MELDKQKIKRDTLFVKCLTKEHLVSWIKLHLKLTLPNYTVDNNSNSNPMDFLWELYSAMMANDPDRLRYLTYANRGGGKSLAVSIFEIISVLHGDRDVVHMAVTEDQSSIVKTYIENFIRGTVIEEFKNKSNKRLIEIVKYVNEKTNKVYSENEYNKLDENEQQFFKRKSNFIKVVVCTLAGASGSHSTILVFDEVETLSGEKLVGYQQAQNIASSRDGILPMVVYISTRQFRYGQMQKEIDEVKVDKRGIPNLHVRHWNVLETTEACTPDFHKPELPKEEIWINDQTLEAIKTEEYILLPEKKQSGFERKEVFAGCVECPIVAGCKGQLAFSKTQKSPLLRSKYEIFIKFKKESLNSLLTEVLCRMPGVEGLVYPKFNKENILNLDKMFEMISGEEKKQATFEEVEQQLIDRGAYFSLGIDYGDTHPFSATLIAVLGLNAYVLRNVAGSKIEIDEQIELCKPFLKYNPLCYGDVARPDLIRTFKKNGFRMKDWKKGAGSVLEGITKIQTLICSANNTRRLFFLEDGEGIADLVKEVGAYHFSQNPDKSMSPLPEKVNDDRCDSLRYGLMNIVRPDFSFRELFNEMEPEKIAGKQQSEEFRLIMKDIQEKNEFNEFNESFEIDDSFF
jgi:hypothetical protein